MREKNEEEKDKKKTVSGGIRQEAGPETVLGMSAAGRRDSTAAGII